MNKRQRNTGRRITALLRVAVYLARVDMLPRIEEKLMVLHEEIAEEITKHQSRHEEDK